MGWIADKFELSRHGAGQNVQPMEGLRGFAVFLVFLVHFVSLTQRWTTPHSQLASFTDAIHTLGNAGVDLFFVLSGYLIYGSLIKREQAFFPFMRRRIVRIYPAFCVVFAIYLALSVFGPQPGKIPPRAAEAWVYILQNFLLLPGIFPIEPIITVAWSLSYEMFYYLAIPAVIALFGLRRQSRAYRVVFFFTLAAAISLYCAIYTGPVRLMMFIVGILLHEALGWGKAVPPRAGYAVLALIAGLLGTTMPFSGSTAFALKTVILSAAFFVVCLACFSGTGSPIARAFSWTPLRWLGNMSYSYYLLHGLTLNVACAWLYSKIPSVSEPGWFLLAMLVPMFAVTLLPTAALFLLVERPLSLNTARLKSPSKAKTDGSESEKAHIGRGV